MVLYRITILSLFSVIEDIISIPLFFSIHLFPVFVFQKSTGGFWFSDFGSSCIIRVCTSREFSPADFLLLFTLVSSSYELKLLINARNSDKLLLQISAGVFWSDKKIGLYLLLISRRGAKCDRVMGG